MSSLYRAIGKEVDAAVPGISEADDNSQGLRFAADAARVQVQKFTANPPAPPPSTLQRFGQIAKDPRVWGPALGAAVGGRYGAVRKLSDLLGP